MALLADLQSTWSGTPEDRARLREAVEAGRETRGGHVEWGRFGEGCGEDGLAVAEYQLAIRDNPDDRVALSRLSVLLQERGETLQALKCAERRFNLDPGDLTALNTVVDLYMEVDLIEKASEAIARARDAGLGDSQIGASEARVRAARKEDADRAPEPEDLPAAESTISISDSDIVRFAHLFSGRENIYARQWWDQSGEGGYAPVREPFTFAVARNHILGSVTVGVYPVRLDNTVNFFALDIDINKASIQRARGSIQESRRLRDLAASEARRLLDALGVLGLPALLEDSGYKGRHIWVFLESPTDASIVRQLGSLFLSVNRLKARELHVELFPKQSSTGPGIGNLIKLPLGIHRRTGRRSRLLLPDGSPDPSPFATLRSVKRVGTKQLYDAIQILKQRAPADAAESAPWEGAGQEQPLPAPSPPPPEPAPAWTAAHFDLVPEVSHLFGSCPVLAALKKRAEDHRRLSHDEQVVLGNAVGHSAPGVQAVNYLLDICVDVPPAARLQKPLAGNPISCPKIRKRIPHVTAGVVCNCLFDFAPNQYPNPRLHLLNMPKDSPPRKAVEVWDPLEAVATLGVLRDRQAKLAKEIIELEERLQKHIEQSGGDRVVIEAGALVLRHEEGALPALVWEPGVKAEEIGTKAPT